MRKTLLAVLAGFGVLTAGCSIKSVDDEPGRVGTTVMLEVAMAPFRAEDRLPHPPPHPPTDCPNNYNAGSVAGECIVFDIQGVGWALLPNRVLPFFRLADNTGCELPSWLPYSETRPASVPAGTRLLRVERQDSDSAILVSLVGEPGTYAARADDSSDPTVIPHGFAFRGSPYFFRPCPSWAK